MLLRSPPCGHAGKFRRVMIKFSLAAMVAARESIVSRNRQGMLGLVFPAICTTVLMASIGSAAAQYYCDERLPSCQTYRQPPPIFPFGLFQPRQSAPPGQPAPRDLP